MTPPDILSTMPPLTFGSPTPPTVDPLDISEELSFLQTNETTYSIYIENPSDMIDPWHSNADFMTIVLTHAITFIVGVIGNSVVIATWARGGKIRSPTATFLVSLACADLLLLIIFMPLETLEYFVITWDRDGHICKLSSFVELLSGMSSILNLVAVSVERFLVIVYPIQARRWCTVTKSRRSLILVWVLAIIFAAPPVFNKSTYSMTYYNNETSITAYYCFEKNDNWAVAFAIYELMTLFIIPATLMIFCYFRVIRELWTSTRVITILTSATAGQYRHTTNPTTAAPANPKDSRSYLVRWPTKKLVSISVNCEQPTPTPVPKIGPNHRSSVSSSGVSSSSTSKANKASSPQPSDHTKDHDSGPPDSPIANGTLGSGPQSPNSTKPKICKLFYCLHNLRTLLWLRPCCSKAGCRKRTKCGKLSGHRGHHRCHHHGGHHQHHFKSRGTAHPPGHHHHLHYHHHRGGPAAVNGMSYQQMKSCCLYKTHCSACAQNIEISSGQNGVPVDTEKVSSVSCSSTCATSTSNGNAIVSPTSPTAEEQTSTSRLLLMCQQMVQLCFCGYCRQDPHPRTPHPVGLRSPYELRNSSSYYGPNQRTLPGTTRLARPCYTMTSSFTNLNTTPAGASPYNMLGTGNGIAVGGATLGSTLSTNGTITAKMSLSVNSVAHQQITTVTLPTPPATTTTPVYHHSTGNGYRAPVTDVRNARKQLYCQVIKMLLFIVILFHICWGPRLIFNVIKSAGIGYFNNIAYNARVYFYLLSFIHSALNPFVYGFMSSNFRRMMLNSCNHRHHHHHHHHENNRHNNSTCHGVNGTANSLMDAINTTSCLNMAHLKASLSRNPSSLPRSNSDLYEPVSTVSHPDQSTSKPKNFHIQRPSQASVYYEEKKSSSSGQHHNSKTSLSIESDDGETSYAEIVTELQQAVDLMSTTRQLHQAQAQAAVEASETKHFLDQIVGRTTRKLHRSSSLFFTFKHVSSSGGGGGKMKSTRGSRASLGSKKSKKKWSERFVKRSNTPTSSRGCDRCRAASTIPRVTLSKQEHSF